MTIRIGTSERDGTFYTQAGALKIVFDRLPALAPVEVLHSNSASIENANRLHAGDIQFGFMASNWIGRARTGAPPFPHPIELRMAAPMNAGPLFFIARKDSTIRSVTDLRGARVVIGAAGSGMVQHAHTIFDVLGLKFSEFSAVYLDFAAGAEALAAGAADVQFQCPIPNKVMTELSERVAVRVLPYAAGQLDALIEAVPYYRATVMRKGAFRGLDADVPQVAVVNVLATHAAVPEATVRAAVGAIIGNADELGRLNPLFLGLRDLFEPLRSQGPSGLEFGGVPLHPGALAAYRNAGLVR